MSSRTTSDDGDWGAADHKLSQLCAQVEEAVAFGLLSSHDPLLRELVVLDVTPIRGAARLRVRMSTESEYAALDDLERAVERARGYLRAEAAAAICRKRAPDLDFEVVPPLLAFDDDTGL